ncbi:DUF6932 family protein [Spirosoma soli]|uniref:DUF6932 family protein n=1 Tax=Spirosoma soli TaxID=1770529 RepID=A0ABW5LY19_9BACT
MIFDGRGLLAPAKVVSLSIAEFEEHFVQVFPDSGTRQTIFASYRRFIEEFTKQVCAECTHWIDGSFVTDKLNPNDLDVVVLIPDACYDVHQSLIESNFRLGGAKQLFPGLDVYTVRCYEAESSKHYITEYDLAYWYDWFTQTRPNRFGKRYKKGFVEVVYKPE